MHLKEKEYDFWKSYELDTTIKRVKYTTEV